MKSVFLSPHQFKIMESSNTTSNRIDVVVFGASGYTGKRIVQTLHHITTKEQSHATWAIAGRNQQKLEAVLEKLHTDTGHNFINTPILIADTEDPASLEAITARTRLIINCTGPYKHHGEAVVRACIQNRCHYIDLNAEPLFLEKIKTLYQDRAEEKAVHIVPGCGLDSIPGDLGLNFLQKHHNGTLNTVETYMEVDFTQGHYFGAVNRGTWHSLLAVLQDRAELRQIQQKSIKALQPNLKPKLHLRHLPHRVPVSGKLACPFPGPDSTVMAHSQLHFYRKRGQRPVQVRTYMATSKSWHCFLLYLAYPFLCLASKFNTLRNIFVRHSRLCSGGIFTAEPSLSVTRNCDITMTLYGKGWRSKVVDPEHLDPEDSWIVVQVRREDGYDMTAICAVSAALVVLGKSSGVPEMGGVYTPAAFFTDTNLVAMLQRNGIKFQVCGQGDL